MKFTHVFLLSLIMTTLSAATAFSHGAVEDHSAPGFLEYGEQEAFGRVGKLAEAIRTVEINMTDAFRFQPGQLRFKAGETVRLVFQNQGALVHEWVLGTPDDIAEHAVLMQRFPNMEHDVPHNVHVPPGESRTLVWQFNRPGSFEVACLLPGHFQAGMKGTLEVK